MAGLCFIGQGAVLEPGCLGPDTISQGLPCPRVPCHSGTTLPSTASESVLRCCSCRLMSQGSFPKPLRPLRGPADAISQWHFSSLVCGFAPVSVKFSPLECNQKVDESGSFLFFFPAKLPLREPFSRKDFAKGRGRGGGQGCRLMLAAPTRRGRPALPAAENISLAVFLLETHQQR